jgi:hypothetical protein
MLAYPPGSPEGHAAVRDRRALDRFVVTLKAEELRVKVLEGKPKSLCQAVNIAEEYAAIVDPNRDSASRSVALPTYHVLEAPAADSSPSHREVRAAPEHDCTAAQAVRELTKAFHRSQAVPQHNQRRQEFSRDNQLRGGNQTRVDPSGPKRKCDAICLRCNKKGHYARECDDSNEAGGVICVDGSCCNEANHACPCATCHFPATKTRGVLLDQGPLAFLAPQPTKL